MDKFYRLLLLLTFAVLCAPDADAQWNDNLSENLLISRSEYSALDMVQVGKTSDDKIFIAWLSWENQNGYIKLQLLDKDGNALFQEGGIYVSRQPTPTWSSGYGFAVTGDGCAVIVNSDMRNSHWQPYAYKISQKGEQLWGEAGIPLLKENEGDGLNPHVCITKSNNVLVGFQNMAGSRIEVKILKLRQDGSPAWGGMISLSGANGIFGMVPSGADGMVVAYYEASTSSYLAMKYTGNGEEVWDEKVRIDDSGLVKTTSEPSLVSDGADGIVTGWRYAISQFSVAGKAQWIDSEGNKKFGDEGILTDELPTVGWDVSSKSLYASYALKSGDEKILTAAEYDEKGNMKWYTDEVSSMPANQFAVYGLIPVSDGVLVVYRNNYKYNEATVEYTKLDLAGKIVKSNVTVSDASGDKGRGGVVAMADQFVVVWSDNALSVYAQNVKEDIGASIEQTSAKETELIKLSYVPEENTFVLRTHLDKPTKGIVSLLDASGKQVADWGKVVLEEGVREYSYPVRGISAGVYMLLVHTSEFSFCGKLVID